MAKQLGNVTKQVVARAISISRANAVAAAQPGEMEKAPRAMKPEASVTGQRQTVGETACNSAYAEKLRALPTGREMVTAASSLPPRRAIPMHAVAISLVVDNGNRRAPLEGGAKRPAGRTRSAGRGLARGLKLVEG